MIEYFQRLGMAFGSDLNAHTYFDRTVYDLEMPNNSPKLLRDSIQLLRDYAGGILLQEDEIEQERGIIRKQETAEFLGGGISSDDEFKLPAA